MTGLVFDFRQMLRGLFHAPRFVLIAVLPVALGIGIATSMFSIVDTALLRPLPYLTPERQVQLMSVNSAGEHVPMGAAEFLQLARHVTTIESLGVFYPHGSIVTSPSYGPRQVRVANLSASMFTTLGIVPSRGRPFSVDEDFAGHDPVAVVTDAYWRRELNGDPSAVGRTLQVGRKPVVVVGVLPPMVSFPRLDRYEIFLSLSITPEQAALTTGRSGLYGIARLKRGVDISAAKAEMDSILHAFNGYGVEVQPLAGWLTGEAAPALRIAFASVLFLLLIACANVTLLLLMRGTARGRDLAIRAALGGGTFRVALQQTMEGVTLCLAAGAVGMVLATFMVRAVILFAPEGIPRLRELQVDLRMALFACAAAVCAGVLSGAVSAWHSLRSGLFGMLRDGGASATPGAQKSRLRDGLIVIQLAMTLLLAVGAGLLVRSMERLLSVPLGVEPRNVLATFVYTQRSSSLDTATDQLLASARGIPGVEAAALVGYLPFENRGWDDAVRVEGRKTSDTAPDVASLNWLTPGYLNAIGIHLLKGRDFMITDTARSTPVGIINQAFVNRYLAGREPIGAVVAPGDWTPTSFIVVGVIQDVRQWGPAAEPLPELYLPQQQFSKNEEAYQSGAMLVIKSHIGKEQLSAALRASVSPLSSQIQLGETQFLDDYLGGHFRQRRFQLDLAVAFAVASLCLAALGIYGSMSFMVVQRRRELAVRAALGAERWQLQGLVLARVVRLAVIGICIGSVSALALSRFLAALLFGVPQHDPMTFAVAAALLAAVALAASLPAAVAASHLNPMTVLRDE